ncbi:MAG: helicase-related protein [Alphaproteobacteria bacterium]
MRSSKSQSNRERALASFKKGEIKVLVATDIAARGIDIDAVSHVVNYPAQHSRILRPSHRPHRPRRERRASPSRSATTGRRCATSSG